GAIVRFGAIEAKISYEGGPLGNSVTLTVTDQLKIVRTNSEVAALGVIVRTAEPQLLMQRPQSAAAGLLLTESTAAVANADTVDRPPAAAEFRAAQRLRVYFRVVNEGTAVEDPKEHELDPATALRDVLGIFKRLAFPNGRYRLYLQEPGRRERLIVEVNIVDGKIVPQNFRETESQGAPLLPQTEAAPAPPPAGQPPAPAQPAAGNAEQPAAGNAVQPASGAIAVSHDRDSSAASLMGVGFGLAATAPVWLDRVQKVIAQGGALPRGRFSRLLRRLAAAPFAGPRMVQNP
ncbi:MAG TPA: hypothetical protein VFB80_09160, partial [Pirellulaceae bacterium]|nr:hypothetical protein [Pirellulaceae bacterium]